MRSPDSIHFQGLSDSIGRLRSEQARQVRSASSGRRVERPSDDAVGSARAVTLRGELSAISATAAAAAHGRIALDGADGALESMAHILLDVVATGTQGATSLQDPVGRKALAAQIRSYSQALLNEGNRKVEGYTLFSGARTATPPYTVAADGSFVYQGDTVVRTLDVDGELVAINAPGDALLTGGVNAGTVLETLAQAVETGDVAGTANALTQVEQLRGQVSAVRTNLGLATARLETAVFNLDRKTEAFTANLSDIEDADMIDVATELERIQLFLSSALGAAGQVQRQPTLFQYLA